MRESCAARAARRWLYHSRTARGGLWRLLSRTTCSWCASLAWPLPSTSNPLPEPACRPARPAVCLPPHLPTLCLPNRACRALSQLGRADDR
eukprot:4810825-Prymnesium_polylepis.1